MCERMAELVALVAVFCVGCYGTPSGNRLLEDLFDKVNYNPLVRPTFQERDNVTVHFGLDIEEILSLHEESGRITTRGILRMWWQDFRLMWDPKEYSGLKQLTIPPSKVWTPDITLYNGIDMELNRDVLLTVYHNGDIVWMVPVVMESTCIHQFRMDSWHCPYQFGSWTLSSRYLDLRPYEGRTDVEMDDKNVGQKWVILDHEGHRSREVLSCCRDPFITMNYAVNLRVKLGHPAIIGKRSIRDVVNSLNKRWY